MWTYHEYGNYNDGPTSFCIYDENRDPLAWLTYDRESAEAARLMAAAPDLLEALEEAWRWHMELRLCNHDCSCQHGLPIGVELSVEAAIAKAKGESHVRI